MTLNRFCKTHPALFALMLAALMIIMFVAAASAHLLPQGGFGWRLCYIGAASLLMFDVLASQQINLGPPNGRNPHRLIYGFYAGYAWMLIPMLFVWKHDAPLGQTFAIWGAMGVLYGGAMIKLGAQQEAPWADRYQIDKDMSQGDWGAVVYYGWPIFVTGWVILAIYNPPTKGWDAPYFLFYVILLGSIVMRHRLKNKLAVWGPRLLGYVLLIAGLYLSKIEALFVP